MTQISPYELVFKVKPITKENIEELHEIDKILENKYLKKQKEIDQINKHKRNCNDLMINDLVLMINRKKESKFEVKWIGPFLITKHLGYGSYEIKSLENGKFFKVSRSDIILYNDKENFESIIYQDENNNLLKTGGNVGVSSEDAKVMSNDQRI